MKYSDTVILVFAKAPVAGKVNTRLIPDIGESAATQLQADFIHQRLQMLSSADLCDVFLMCAHDINHEYFKRCKQRYPVTLVEQRGEDLGERLLDGIEKALERYRYCIVIGTDAPALDATVIQQAIDVLHKQTEVVFVPAEDGGYVLVGLQKAYDFLFQNINWGTAEVMQQCRDVLRLNNIVFDELEECWDVDVLQDYERYLQMRK